MRSTDPNGAALREMARHFPPSGAALRLLDVYNPSAGLWTALRPDVQTVQADQRPFPDGTLDAITAHGKLLDDPTVLAEFWRALRPGGRLILFMADPSSADPTGGAQTLAGAGYVRVFGERIAGGLLFRGEKPYRRAENRPLNTDLAIIDPANLLTEIHARYVFLLVHQTPHKPIWALTPDDPITWGAASVTPVDHAADSQSAIQPIALAFSSLPNAVAFMQPAALSGVLIGISKVAKFSLAAAARWDFPILLNPALESLVGSGAFRLSGARIGVDPRTAVTGDE